MGRILLFAGTSEGRELAEYLENREIYAKVFSATEYGEKLVSGGKFTESVCKRLDENEIADEIRRENADVVIDATHPFAQIVSQNIQKACDLNGAEYIRLLRDFGEGGKDCDYVENVEEAVDYFNRVSGKVFITTGSKNLDALTNVRDYQNRLAIRILPDSSNLEKAISLGFKPENIICMQGPFSEKFNAQMLKAFGAEYMLTKETGDKGGFYEKISACKCLGVKPVVISRPQEKGHSFNDVKKIIDKKHGIPEKKKVYIIGAGCGDFSMFTQRAVEAIKESGLIISTDRIIESLRHLKKETAIGYKAHDVINIIGKSSEKIISVIFSGDIGFFSGAKELGERLKNAEIDRISGISSLVYFMGRLGKGYERTKTISLHGREQDYVGEIRENSNVFMLLGGENTAQKVCQCLTEYGFGDVKIYVGENLSYENERITVGSAKELMNTKFDKLSVLLAENPRSEAPYIGIADEKFIRGAVPMTKSEVRAVSISKLKLNKDAIVYDIGAGTGSISVEAALNSRMVYAVERNSPALKLIKENSRKFGVFNIKIVEGEAPAALKELPPPTHVFMGGTGGSMERIITAVLYKNPSACFVVNAVTVETVAETLRCIKKLNLCEEEISLIQVSKGKNAGESHLMMANNPVYVISFKGKGERKNE